MDGTHFASVLPGLLFVGVGVVLVIVGPSLTHAIGVLLDGAATGRQTRGWVPPMMRILGCIIVVGGILLALAGPLGWT